MLSTLMSGPIRRTSSTDIGKVEMTPFLAQTSTHEPGLISLNPTSIEWSSMVWNQFGGHSLSPYRLFFRPVTSAPPFHVLALVARRHLDANLLRYLGVEKC